MITKTLLSATKTAYRECGERLIEAIENLKIRLQARYEQEYPGHALLIYEAIEEAELLSWATPFPHLFLPDFAEIRIENLIRDAVPLRDRPEVSLALAA